MVSFGSLKAIASEERKSGQAGQETVSYKALSYWILKYALTTFNYQSISGIGNPNAAYSGQST